MGGRLGRKHVMCNYVEICGRKWKPFHLFPFGPASVGARCGSMWKEVELSAKRSFQPWIGQFMLEMAGYGECDPFPGVGRYVSQRNPLERKLVASLGQRTVDHAKQ